MTWRKQNELESIPCIPRAHGFLGKNATPRPGNDNNIDSLIDSSSSDLLNGISIVGISFRCLLKKKKRQFIFLL